MKPPVDIIIPTWNLPEYFNPCVRSIISTGVINGLARLIIVNNGDQPISEMFKEFSQVTVLKPKENLGWEGGLDLALKNSDAPFVVFQNDDTFIPKACFLFYQRLLVPFVDRSVAAVAPVSTVVSGPQSIFHPNTPRTITEVSYLIFCCVMLRREDIDRAGGIDTTLPGGDDLDLSIRLRRLGRHLLIHPDAFLIHHGFKSGNRLRGDGYAGVKNGWNSPEMIETTQKALIRKHGFKTWFETVQGLQYPPNGEAPSDPEADMIRQWASGENILELGCGGKKTVANAVGIDRVQKGEEIPFLAGQKSIADLTGDVQSTLPVPEQSQDCIIARHILEHCLDTLGTLAHWNKALRIGGRLIVAVPDEEITNGIPINPEHVHAFNEKTLSNFMKAAGFKPVELKSTGNGVSFVGCFEKIEHMNGQYA